MTSSKMYPPNIFYVFWNLSTFMTQWPYTDFVITCESLYLCFGGVGGIISTLKMTEVTCEVVESTAICKKNRLPREE
jgi:hypothetical protein